MTDLSRQKNAPVATASSSQPTAATLRSLTTCCDGLPSYASVSPADWRFTTNEHGRPSIDSEDHHLAAISFSLPHTRAVSHVS
jgi:hypothetical protein